MREAAQEEPAALVAAAAAEEEAAAAQAERAAVEEAESPGASAKQASQFLEPTVLMTDLPSTRHHPPRPRWKRTLIRLGEEFLLDPSADIGPVSPGEWAIPESLSRRGTASTAAHAEQEEGEQAEGMDYDGRCDL